MERLGSSAGCSLPVGSRSGMPVGAAWWRLLLLASFWVVSTVRFAKLPSPAARVAVGSSSVLLDQSIALSAIVLGRAL